jgi:hypothetical protein
MYHHNKDIRMWDDMIPWERDVYLGMMVREIEEENLKLALEAANRRAQGKKPARMPKKKK